MREGESAMNNCLIIALIFQVCLTGYFLSNGVEEKGLESPEKIRVYVEIPEIDNEVVRVNVPAPLKKKQKTFDYKIPERRIYTGNGIELDKNINAVGIFGEAMLENPLMVRGLEKLVRNQFFHFYADFIKEADLTPQEQAELFKLMAQAMEDNLKSMMAALGEDMGQMSELKNGPPPSLVEGVKENNLALKENLIMTLGQEKFELFEQYHKEKSAAQEFMRVSDRLKRSEVPLDQDQEDGMRQLFIDNQHSPFSEETYSDQINYSPMYEQSSEVLNDDQQKVFKRSRKKHDKVYLLPF